MANTRKDLIDNFLTKEKNNEPVQEEDGDEEAKDAIESLANTDYSDNEDQGKFVELLKGLAFSDNELATEFVADLQAKADDSAEAVGVDI